MMRVLIGAECLLLLWAPAVHAADAAGDTTIIKLVVEPKAEPRPALRYALLPDLDQMEQGNPVPAYLKCLMEQNNFFYGKQENDKREKWLTCPLSQLPADAADYSGGIGKQADFAARLTACDWQALNTLRADGTLMLSPEVQQMRALSRVLKVRYRGQVKAGRFDDALKTHQTIFAMAHHLNQYPSLIGNLVGVAVAFDAIGPFEEMIQQPGCPNLYWALAQLPSSLVDFRKGTEGARAMLVADFGPSLPHVHVWSKADMRRLAERAMWYCEPAQRTQFEKWAGERLNDKNWLAEARKSLIEAGFPARSVNDYPPEQVLFHKLWPKYEAACDEQAKWISIPYWQAEPQLIKLNEPAARPDTEDGIVAALAQNSAVFAARARFDQRIAMLRVIEAVRLHAAANDGKLPAQLDEIKLVPVPVDPVTGKPFAWQAEGTAVVLRNTPPHGKEKAAGWNVRYELTVRK